MNRPAPLRFLWEHHKPTLLLILAAILVAVFFAGRFVVHAIYWQQVYDTDPILEPWMTPRYISKAWDVPLESFGAILDTSETKRRPSLADIARAQGRPVEDLIADLTKRLIKAQGPKR